jgi:hypothetical protein
MNGLEGGHGESAEACRGAGASADLRGDRVSK